MRRSTMTLTVLSALVLAGTPAMANDQHDKTDVSKASEGEWISLTGTVKSVSPEQFTMNYGKGQITVEMDDYDWYDENFVLTGDKVTVTGRMDADFYENKKIEANTVYLPKIQEYYYASSADEEDGYYSYPVASYDWNTTAEDDEWVALTGTVERIGEAQLTLDTGVRDLTVDTGDMMDSPIDEQGTKLVDVGDRVSVSGEMDDADLFDTREIEASSMVVLTNSAA